MAFSKLFPAGIYELQVAVLNDNGVMMGQISEPDNPTPNTTSHAYYVNHPVTVVPGAPTYTVATERSGQQYRGDVDLGMEALGEFTFTLAEIDLQLNALLTQSKVVTNYSDGWTEGGNNQSVSIPRRVALIFTGGGVSRDDATLDNRGYRHMVVPSCTVRATEAGANQSGGENPIPLTYTVRPGLSNKLPNGVLFDAIDPLMYAEGETFWHPIMLNYKIGMTTWVANGSASTFTLGYRPLFSDATASGRNRIARVIAGQTHGNQVAVASVNTTTGVVTASSAGNNLDIYNAWYPTNRVTI